MINKFLKDSVDLYRKFGVRIMWCYIEGMIYEYGGYLKCRECKYSYECNKNWYKLMR